MKRMAIVLAAGKGTRMKSKLSKVLHPVCGKPMVEYVLDAVEEAKCEKCVMIVGYDAEAIKDELGSRIYYAMQEQQLGTGHAVLQAAPILKDEEGTTIVICADTPLITSDTLNALVASHEDSGAAATILTSVVDNPTGYGHIIRNKELSVERIVEHKDATIEEADICEINTGTYCFNNKKLFASLKQIKNDNAQREYYLPDVIRILRAQGEVVSAYLLADKQEAIGINNRIHLSIAQKIMQAKINRYHQLQGVTIQDPTHTYIESEVRIGADTIILPGTLLQGKTCIGSDCIIGPDCELKDTQVLNGAIIRHTIAEQTNIGSECKIGPFAYLRPGTNLGERVKVGDFVEIKNTVIGPESKVPHLSYVGDAIVGKNVNIGCGAVTANYNGNHKAKTEIGDQAFIGCNVNLIAPIKVGDQAYVVAGSTITKNVDENDLAIARGRQVNKKGYAEKIRSRIKQKE